MDKIWLIIKREYLTRVKKKSFILTTLLTPLAILLFVVVVGFIFSYQSDDVKSIVILDESNMLDNKMKDNSNLHFKFSNETLDALKARYEEGKFDGVLVVPPLKTLDQNDLEILYYSDKPLEFETMLGIQQKLERRLREYKIDALELDRRQLESLSTHVTIEPEPINEEAKDQTSLSGVVGAIIGGVMGYFMFFIIFLYGLMVMRSVMEEKVNRIVEIIISSVKPFQLMLGKIVGVGAVGFTQLAIWMVIIPIITITGQLVFNLDANQMNEITGNPAAAEVDMEDAMGKAMAVLAELKAQNWLMIIPLFILYFIGGYMIYTSLFAAVGSAMGDDLQEGQTLTIPITIPIVLAVYIMFRVVSAPHSSLAVWSSIFPLFSPIIMPARLASNPPLWEIVLSVTVLIASAFFFVWLSGRIYRVGILMYGKKVTFKELGKWMFAKDI